MLILFIYLEHSYYIHVPPFLKQSQGGTYGSPLPHLVLIKQPCEVGQPKGLCLAQANSVSFMGGREFEPWS